jgi:hypothetical protein
MKNQNWIIVKEEKEDKNPKVANQTFMFVFLFPGILCRSKTGNGECWNRWRGIRVSVVAEKVRSQDGIE